MSKKKVIEIKNVGVVYKEKSLFFKGDSYTALKDISFDVFQSETLGIIGRNGAGKSTLLRLLAGIIKPDYGSIVHHTRSVSLMALQAGFDGNLSGRQNAVISGMLIGHRKSEVVANLEKIKDFSELRDFFDKPVKTYSSGMRARLGFSIALYISPDVLLIDEVLAVGDSNFRKKAELAITEKINSDLTVILVSHSESQMRRLVDRVVWINNGEVKYAQTAKKVFEVYNFVFDLEKKRLVIKDIYINPAYFLAFSDVAYNNEKLSFDMTVLHDDEHTQSIKVISHNDEIILSDPVESKQAKTQYPKNKHANNALFKKVSLSQKSSATFYAYNSERWEKIFYIDFI